MPTQQGQEFIKQVHAGGHPPSLAQISLLESIGRLDAGEAEYLRNITRQAVAGTVYANPEIGRIALAGGDSPSAPGPLGVRQYQQGIQESLTPSELRIQEYMAERAAEQAAARAKGMSTSAADDPTFSDFMVTEINKLFAEERAPTRTSTETMGGEDLGTSSPSPNPLKDLTAGNMTADQLRLRLVDQINRGEISNLNDIMDRLRQISMIAYGRDRWTDDNQEVSADNFRDFFHELAMDTNSARGTGTGSFAYTGAFEGLNPGMAHQYYNRYPEEKWKALLGYVDQGKDKKTVLFEDIELTGDKSGNGHWLNKLLAENPGLPKAEFLDLAAQTAAGMVSAGELPDDAGWLDSYTRGNTGGNQGLIEARFPHILAAFPTRASDTTDAADPFGATDTPGATIPTDAFNIVGPGMPIPGEREFTRPEQFEQFLSRSPADRLPELRAGYRSMAPMLEQQFLLQEPTVGPEGFLRRPTYRDFLRGESGTPPVFGQDLKDRIMQIANLLSRDPAMGETPGQAFLREQYSTPEDQATLFSLPYLMGSTRTGQRGILSDVIDRERRKFEELYPSGATLAGQQFLPWAIEQNLLDFGGLYGQTTPPAFQPNGGSTPGASTNTPLTPAEIQARAIEARAIQERAEFMKQQQPGGPPTGPGGVNLAAQQEFLDAIRAQLLKGDDIITSDVPQSPHGFEGVSRTEVSNHNFPMPGDPRFPLPRYEGGREATVWQVPDWFNIPKRLADKGSFTFGLPDWL